VLENLRVLRAECTKDADDLLDSVNRQLKKKFPELVRLFKLKNGGKGNGFSVHKCRHLKEAFCATVYIPKGMSRDLYRMRLFAHEGRDTGAHYHMFDHKEGMHLPPLDEVDSVDAGAGAGAAAGSAGAGDDDDNDDDDDDDDAAAAAGGSGASSGGSGDDNDDDDDDDDEVNENENVADEVTEHVQKPDYILEMEAVMAQTDANMVELTEEEVQFRLRVAEEERALQQRRTALNKRKADDGTTYRMIQWIDSNVSFHPTYRADVARAVKAVKPTVV
jgi:hypothetical protein